MSIPRSYKGLLAELKNRILGISLLGKAASGKRLRNMFCPKISIVTPSYNQAQYLEDTIQSVLNQNYPNCEHIVIDGGSTDGTVETLSKYPHLKWMSEKDNGQSEALNKGLRMATGDIIGIINSDDFYCRNAFKYLVKAVDTYTDAKIFIGDCRFIYEGSKRSFVVSNKDLSFEDIIRYWDTWIPPTQPAIFFMRDLIDEFGCFDCSLDKAMDYDMWLRFSRKHVFYHIPLTLAVYRFHGQSKSGMGDDWSSFYDEWHQVYLRNKKYSKTLPPSPLISTILYLCRDDADSVRSAYRAVDTCLDYVNNQRLKDIEIIVVTDLDELQVPSIVGTKVSLNIVHVPKVTPLSFVDTVSKHAHGSYIHCPTYDAIYPDRWYCDNLSKLLDNCHLASSGNPENSAGRHKFLLNDVGIPANTLIRFDKSSRDIMHISKNLTEDNE